MLALTLSGLWKWTGLRTSCRCVAPYIVCGIATDPTVFILFETVSLASKK
jgi:hypothetical protein